MDAEKLVYRSIVALIVAVVLGLTVTSLDDIKRYIRISRM